MSIHNDKPARPVLIRIGEAASLVGVSPSTLRNWEREELITPHRVQGRTRYYSLDSIKKLRRIHQLRRDEGLNASGIRRVLAQEQDEPPQHDSTDDRHPGQQILRLRHQQNRPLRELAKQAEISPSFLSAIERGIANPSLAVLHRIGRALGTTSDFLFDDGQRKASQKLIRPADRIRLETRAPEMSLELLAKGAKALEPHLVTIPPGGGSGEAYTHAGEEFLFVLKGQIEVILDELEIYRLRVGDALTFPSETSHRLRNPGTSTARAIWVNTPPTF